MVHVPIIVEAWAIPTIHTPLFASAAISPVTVVPWLFEDDIENKLKTPFQLLLTFLLSLLSIC